MVIKNAEFYADFKSAKIFGKSHPSKSSLLKRFRTVIEEGKLPVFDTLCSITFCKSGVDLFFTS
jgi:hypothetical protein